MDIPLSPAAIENGARLSSELRADVDAVARIDAIPTMLDVVCRITGMRFAAVARVTPERWIACSVHDDIQFGLQPGGELAVETTICHEIMQSGQAVSIDHVANDTAFSRHPTPAMYGFQSYISVPIVLPDGAFFGTLCAIDPDPVRVNTPETLGMFRLFAELIAFHLDAQQRLADSETSLSGERRSAELREQFIAVLGHDLRNPLASIASGVQILRRAPLDDKGKSVLALIQNSVQRMSALIDDVLDFARGRLGGGLALERNADEPLRATIENVIAELRSAHADHVIELSITDPIEPVACDRLRIGQLLSNLVSNALVHGAPAATVRVSAAMSRGTFELAVMNQGEPIPASMIEKLFEPFFRAAARPNRQGLGLGLYIANEIARAHGGTLSVASSGAETRVVFRMPVS